MRSLMILFAAVAMIWSGMHAEPVDAHAFDGAHWSETSNHDEQGEGGDAAPDQHGCHHHCPNAPAPADPVSDDKSLYGDGLRIAGAPSRLNSTSRAPPLDPPIA